MVVVNNRFSNNKNNVNKDTTKLNGDIKTREVRLILEDGSANVMLTSEALKIASDQGLDLVEINSHATTPVCKIMDYSKYRFDQQKSKKEADKKQREVAKKQKIKEISFKLGTDKGDLQRKQRDVLDFINEGMKVKIEVKLRGRELQRKDKAMETLQDFLDNALQMSEVPDIFKFEVQPKIEGSKVTAIVAPNIASK